MINMNDIKPGCVIEFKNPIVERTDVSRFGFIICPHDSFSSCTETSISYAIYFDENNYRMFSSQYSWFDDEDLVNDLAINVYNKLDTFTFMYDIKVGPVKILSFKCGINHKGEDYVKYITVQKVSTGEIFEIDKDASNIPPLAVIDFTHYTSNDTLIQNNQSVLKDIYDILGE